jgi:hypothetical protein
VLPMLVNPLSPDAPPEIRDVQATAQGNGVPTQNVERQHTQRGSLDKQRPDVVLVRGDPFFVLQREERVTSSHDQDPYETLNTATGDRAYLQLEPTGCFVLSLRGLDEATGVHHARLAVGPRARSTCSLLTATSGERALIATYE